METPSHVYNALGYECKAVLFQDIFRELCPSATLTEDVEEAISKIVYATIKTVVDGSCKLTSLRSSERLELEDVALYLKTQFNLDPLQVSDNYYYVTDCSTTSSSIDNIKNPSKSSLRKLSEDSDEYSPSSKPSSSNSGRKRTRRSLKKRYKESPPESFDYCEDEIVQ